jgi:hypothetical protein
VFEDRIANGSGAVGPHNLLDLGHQRQSCSEWVLGIAQVDYPPATAPAASGTSTSPSAFATPAAREPATDDDDDNDTLETQAVGTGSSLLRGKRSATGETPALKRAKKVPVSCQYSLALGNIAQQLSVANSLREREFQERRPPWKRAWEVIRDNYEIEWAKLTPGALGCLYSVLSQCPINLIRHGSTATYADLILAIGNDKRRDKYVFKALKLATGASGGRERECGVE